MKKYLSYLWYIPALYVAFEFGSKFFEVLSDKQEFVDIISSISLLSPAAPILAYVAGIFDFAIAIALLTFSMSKRTRKYHYCIFLWTIFWPFIPSSVRYFNDVAPFEIGNVLLLSSSALIAYALWERYARKK